MKPLNPDMYRLTTTRTTDWLGKSGWSAYLFVLIVGTRHVSPLFDDAAQVHRVEWHLHLADLVVFREAVKVVDRERQRLRANLCERHLQQATTLLVTCVDSQLPLESATETQTKGQPEFYLRRFASPWNVYIY